MIIATIVLQVSFWIVLAILSGWFTLSALTASVWWKYDKDYNIGMAYAIFLTPIVSLVVLWLILKKDKKPQSTNVG